MQAHRTVRSVVFGLLYWGILSGASQIASAQTLEPQISGDLTSFLPNQAGAASEQQYLVQNDGRLFGLPLVGSDAQLVDLGIDGIDSEVVWDWYGTGILTTRVASDGDIALRHVWHVSLADQNETQLTDRTCFSPSDSGARFAGALCHQTWPMAASIAGGLAYIQDAAFWASGRQTETPSKLLVMLNGDTLVGAFSLNRTPKTLSWSGDGMWLLFADEVEQNGGKDLRAIHLASGKECGYANVDSRTIDHVDWSGRNGGEVIYSAAGDLWKVPLKTSGNPRRCPSLQLNKKTQITSTPEQELRPQWINESGIVAYLRKAADGSLQIHALNVDAEVYLVQTSSLSFPVANYDWQGVKDADRARLIGNINNTNQGPRRRP